MKKIIVLLIMLCVCSAIAYAQMSPATMGEQKGMMCQQGMMMGEGKQMPTMNCPKMQQGQGMMQYCPQMMGQGMMMKDIMQMMMDMMKMQEKLLKGVKGHEKQQAMKDMTQMKEKIQNMMSMCKCMMMGGMMGGMMGQHSDISQCRLNCAEQWLKKAIDLHEVHIKDPKTATEASQMEMMEQMKKAYNCIIGVSEICGTPLKEPSSKETEEAEPSKTEPHKQ